MKTVFKRIVCTLLVICSLSSLAWANAIQARTSSTLNYYSANLSASANRTVSVSANITGRGDCSEIGISRVYVYESSDGGKTFSLYKTYLSSDYPSMMDSGITYCKAPISFTGTIGNQYKATVYCHAVCGSDTDTKSYETNTVTARR